MVYEMHVNFVYRTLLCRELCVCVCTDMWCGCVGVCECVFVHVCAYVCVFVHASVYLIRK